MNLQQIRYFLELAKELHFWKTSEKMFITQSALSRQILSLEQELGFKLFERNKRSVKLTPAGEFLCAEWKKMLAEIENIHRHAQKITTGEIGEIKIGYPGSIAYSILPGFLEEFVKKYPDLQIGLIEFITVELERALLGYEIDAGFKREPAENKTLDSRKLLTENFCVVVADAHPLAGPVLNDLSLLKNERFILPSISGGHLYARTLQEIFKEYDFMPNIYLQSEFGSMILGLVARGIGVSLLPFSYSFHAPQGVRFIKIPHQTSLYIVWRKKDANPVLNNFLQTIEKVDLLSGAV